MYAPRLALATGEKRVKHFNCFDLPPYLCQHPQPQQPNPAKRHLSIPSSDILALPSQLTLEPPPPEPGIPPPPSPTMASFFDLKARKQAAANGAGSQKQDKTAQPPRMQPWVEK